MDWSNQEISLFKSQSPHPERALAPRVFHLNLHAIERALAPRIFHLNHDAIELALVPRVFHLNVSFRQGCEACLCKSEPDAEGRLGADVFRKQGVHVIADAISQIVAGGAHTSQSDDY
jgi:hypothetical protein